MNDDAEFEQIERVAGGNLQNEHRAGERGQGRRGGSSEKRERAK
jgi:hypothetical protein